MVNRSFIVSCGLVASMSLLVLVVAGCRSSGADRHRMARYRPDVDARDRSPWKLRSETGRVQSSVDVDAFSEETFVQVTEDAPGTVPVEDGEKNAETSDISTRILEPFERIEIHVTGVPEGVITVGDEIDAEGVITLAYLQDVKVAGLTTQDAEKLIERLYRDKRIYEQPNVVIISLTEGHFFVRGEVKKPLRYPLIGDMTLTEAIIMAQGYTDFAKRSKIIVLREGEEIRCNAKRIEARKDPDPVILSGDQIIVPRAMFLR